MEGDKPDARVILSMKVGPMEKMPGVELHIQHTGSHPEVGDTATVVYIMPNAFARQLRDKLGEALNASPFKRLDS